MHTRYQTINRIRHTYALSHSLPPSLSSLSHTSSHTHTHSLTHSLSHTHSNTKFTLTDTYVPKQNQIDGLQQ
jgi:pyruvate/oxaloacetate carboxyltransferase